MKEKSTKDEFARINRAFESLPPAEGDVANVPPGLKTGGSWLPIIRRIVCEEMAASSQICAPGTEAGSK